MQVGVVYKGIGGLYHVRISGRTLQCKARGRIKKDSQIIAVGDMVEVDMAEATIERILPRKNIFHRPTVANVEYALVVFAAASPSPSFLLMDKILLTAENAFIEPVLCINKTDLGTVDMARYAKSGYSIKYVSAATGEGIEELSKFLEGKTTVMSGPSGAGKSSLINAITGRQAVTGAVSGSANRGRHTTRHSELYELSGGGILADSPGFGAMNLSYIPKEEIRELFPEFIPFRTCRYKDCIHIAEPECAVREAAGQGSFPAERYKSYLKIMEEL